MSLSRENALPALQMLQKSAQILKEMLGEFKEAMKPSYG